MAALRYAPLPRRLLILAAVALLPVVVFAAASLVLLARQQAAEIERATIETMRALIGSVDSELNRSIAAAEALAATDSLDRGDLRRFYEEARRVLLARPEWSTVILSDPSGRQLVNGLHPFGAPLPATTVDAESFNAARETRRPSIVGVLVGPSSGLPVFGVRVPIVRQGNVRYVLTAAVRPQAMLRVIEHLNVPPGGLVTIFDARANIVARSRAQAEYVGKPISPAFRTLISRGPEGWGIASTVDGQRVYVAYSLSDFSRWGVGIGLPPGVIDAPLRRSYLFLGAGVLLSLALGVGASLFAARRIARPIEELRRAAIAVGRGQLPSPVPTTIPEVRDVAEALSLAAYDRRRAEGAREDLLRKEREARTVAEEANRVKDEFLAMLGHELRNPLAAISNAVHVLEQRAGRSKDGAHAILRRQVEHLTHLVDDLLDVERVMTGKIALERSPLELADVVEHTLATLNAAGRLDRHDLEVNTSSVWVDADATRIDQIVANLVVNAVKYTPAGKGIAISVAREDGEAVLRVRDEGVGIEPALLPRIFDLFVQGKRSLDRAQGGLGIGLTLVRRLADLHGGTVTAESEGLGRGSSFTLRLPAVEPPANLPQARPIAPPPVSRTVLIVEDNHDARATLRELLETAGHTVHEAIDGPRGLDAALKLRPEVAFVDLGLPGMDGLELARRIRASPEGRGLRLVALTGYGSAADRARSREAGFDVHLVKPVDRETLERVLAG
jgi:signal transduction histidine kinase/CheY-like chemotaxis protein